MSSRFRLLGLLPLSFFLLNFIHHAKEGHPHHILWLCNLDNLLLAAGFLFNAPLFFRIGILWLIPGFPLWLIESFRNNDLPFASVLAHCAALVLGLFLLPRFGMKSWTWAPAFAYALFVQQICRWITPPSLNINVAFSMYPGWENTFNHYWQFWLFIAFESAAAMFLLSVLLSRIFPAKTPTAPLETM